MILRNKIAKLRNSKGLSQAELAKLLNVGKQTIANWENGRREPNIDNLCTLSNIFDVSIDYILNNQVVSGDWFDYDVSDISKCMNGEYICIGVPEAIVITKALKRMDNEQRSKLLTICEAVYPAEFADLSRKKHTGSD